MRQRYKYPLNLQLFAEGDPDPEVIEEELTEPTEPTFTQADIDALTAKIDALTTDMKRQTLKSTGLKGDDIEAALEFVTGSNPEEIASSIASLSDELPVLIRVAALRKPMGIDPNPGNGRKSEPRAFDYAASTKARIDRLRKSGKIRS